MFKGEVPRSVSSLNCSNPLTIELYEAARDELAEPTHNFYSVFRDKMVLAWAGCLSVDEVYGVINAANYDHTDIASLAVVADVDPLGDIDV